MAACATGATTTATSADVTTTGTSADATTTATSADATTTTTSATVDTAVIAVSGTELTVWIADTAEERRQGLREVEELPVDGMLFSWDAPTATAFTMRDTLIPLDIWWFDRDGVLIGMTEMGTCPDGDCVSYASPGSVRWALETPAGIYGFDPGDRLTTSESG